jgi:hypothetical protein
MLFSSSNKNTEPIMAGKIKLTVANVKTLGDGYHHDSGCPSLYLVVRHDGRSRIWRQRGSRWLNLGPLDELPLADARARVIQNKALIAQGKEPQAGKPSKSKPGVITLELDARAYHAWRGDWSPIHAATWLNSMINHVFPKLGERETTSLTPADLVSVIQPPRSARQRRSG